MEPVTGGQIQTQNVRFEAVKSMKNDNSATPMSAGAKAAWVIGALVGIACGSGNGCGSA